MVTVGIFSFKKNSHGRAGNRTRDLMISSQRLRPLDHEAGRNLKTTKERNKERKKGSSYAIFFSFILSVRFAFNLVYLGKKTVEFCFFFR